MRSKAMSCSKGQGLTVECLIEGVVGFDQFHFFAVEVIGHQLRDSEDYSDLETNELWFSIFTFISTGEVNIYSAQIFLVSGAFGTFICISVGFFLQMNYNLEF